VAIKGLIIFLARGVSVSCYTFPEFNKISLPFSRGRIHDLFDQWNRVKLCVGFLYFRISYLFFLSLPDDPVFLLHRSATTSIKAYQHVLQQLVSEQGQREDVCNQVRYSIIQWCHQFQQVAD